MTFARVLFEARAVENFDVPAAVADDRGELQAVRGDGDALAPHAEQMREHLVRHFDLVGAQQDATEQEAAAQLLLDRVMAIADSRLRDLRLYRAHVPAEQVARAIERRGRPPARATAAAASRRRR